MAKSTQVQQLTGEELLDLIGAARRDEGGAGRREGLFLSL